MQDLTRYRFRQAAGKQRVPRDTAGIFTTLIAAADDDVIDVFRFERTFIDDSLHNVAQQVVRTDTRKRPAVPAEGRAFTELEISVEHVSISLDMNSNFFIEQ